MYKLSVGFKTREMETGLFMRKIFIVFLLAFLGTVPIEVLAQCWLTQLAKDINKGSAEFKDFVKNSESAFDSYRSVVNAQGMSSLLKTDVAVLDNVAKLKNDSKFIQAIGGESGFNNFLRTATKEDILARVLSNAPRKLADRLDQFPNIKNRIHSFNDDVKRQKFLDDFADASDEVLSKFNASNGKLITPWEKLSTLTGAREWTRKSIPLLEKMANRSDDIMDKVKQYYSTHQKPAETGAPPFVHQGTPFDEFAHPNFVPEVPNIPGHGKIKYQPKSGETALNGGSSDFTNANNWAERTLNVNGQINFIRVPNSTRFKIKAPDSPFADVNGWVECVWHHHEDAKTLLPAPMQTHNRSFPTGSSHTGGASILEKPELHDLIGFFDSPTGI